MDKINERWGGNALSLGWTSIPTALFFLQSQRGISSTAFCVLLNLIVHWWEKKEWPHPSVKGLSIRIGVTERTIQRAFNELEHKKLIKKLATKRGSIHRGRNMYDLTGLIQFLDQEGDSISLRIKSKEYKPSSELKHPSFDFDEDFDF